MYLLPTKIFAAVVLICVSQVMQVAAQEEKMWYRGTEIAPYRVIGKYYQNNAYYAYELREYPQAYWVTAGTNGFGTLFQYISGNNARGEKIKMTAPVLNTVFATGNYTYEMAFYIPQIHQQNPPAPRDSRVTLKLFPTTKVFVRTYGGWSNTRTVREELQKLMTALNYDNKKYSPDVVYTAGYNGPWSWGTRRNEVWLVAEDK